MIVIGHQSSDSIVLTTGNIKIFFFKKKMQTVAAKTNLQLTELKIGKNQNLTDLLETNI